MASSNLTLEEIYNYFKDNGNVVKNRDLVHHFKGYLTDPASKDDARVKFKKIVNTLAQTKTENGEKYLMLKTKYVNSLEAPKSPDPHLSSPHQDPRISLGIPLSPSHSVSDYTPSNSPAHRQPPPYRPPPPVSSPSSSLDNISIISNMSQESTPQVPPRKKSTEKQKSISEESTPVQQNIDGTSRVEGNEEDDEQSVSVKKRTEKFNRLISVEDELSPRQQKVEQKNKTENKGVEEDDGASVTSLEPKKCMEWYVTASRGDLQELVKLAKDEPRLVNKKDPFSAYTVLHWGAKHGNAEIIKVFAGKYKVDVNGKTNGGYTPLHMAAQFSHKDIFKLLIEVYKANTKIRDNSGRLPDYYLAAREQKGRGDNIRKIKGRKKQSEKDLGFLRIGSLNVRVKKTTEAFSNFLGVGSSSINPLDLPEKVHKGWGSADNLNQENAAPGVKGINIKKKIKRPYSSGLGSTPGTPKQLVKNLNLQSDVNDSDSDSAAGFDSQWKN